MPISFAKAFLAYIHNSPVSIYQKQDNLYQKKTFYILNSVANFGVNNFVVFKDTHCRPASIITSKYSVEKDNQNVMSIRIFLVGIRDKDTCH